MISHKEKQVENTCRQSVAWCPRSVAASQPYLIEVAVILHLPTLRKLSVPDSTVGVCQWNICPLLWLIN